MGSPPPVNLPPPTAAPPDPFAAPTLPVASLCGFKLPTLNFKLGFKLPTGALSIPPSLPLPKLPFGLNCAQNNPQNASNGVSYGGGRTPNQDPSPDLDETSF